MYFSGKLEIDPSKMTVIQKVKPNDTFKKIIHSITFGKAASDKEEHETFNALGIGQQLYAALLDKGINDIVRINMNGHDFYFDKRGEKNDLDKAMLEFETSVDPLEAGIFKNLLFVAEHDENKLKYLIEIKVDRTHKIGEYPIQIVMNGLISDLQMKAHESKEDLERRMGAVFATRESYDNYVRTMRSQFDSFVNDMDMSLRKFIQADDIRNSTKAKLIRAKEKVNSMDKIRTYEDRLDMDPVFHGYFAMNTFFMYSFMWSSMAYANNVHINNVDIIDETGADVMSVGENGFDAGEVNTLNEDAPFEVPEGADTETFSGNEFEDELGGGDLATDDITRFGEESDSG